MKNTLILCAFILCAIAALAATTIAALETIEATPDIQMRAEENYQDALTCAKESEGSDLACAECMAAYGFEAGKDWAFEAPTQEEKINAYLHK